MNVNEAIQTLRDAADTLDKPALAVLAVAAQAVVDSDRHSVVYPLRWESDEGHAEVSIAWTAVESHRDGRYDHSIGVAKLDSEQDGEHAYMTCRNKAATGMVLAAHVSVQRVAQLLHELAMGEGDQ